MQIFSIGVEVVSWLLPALLIIAGFIGFKRGKKLLGVVTIALTTALIVPVGFYQPSFHTDCIISDVENPAGNAQEGRSLRFVYASCGEFQNYDAWLWGKLNSGTVHGDAAEHARTGEPANVVSYGWRFPPASVYPNVTAVSDGVAIFKSTFAMIWLVATWAVWGLLGYFLVPRLLRKREDKATGVSNDGATKIDWGE